jgi:hypothetical protein
MVQGQSRLGPVDALGIADFVAAKSTRDLLGECLLISEFGKKRLVEQVLYVLGVVKGGGVAGALSDLGLVSRLAWIYSSQRSAKCGRRNQKIPLKMQSLRKSGRVIWSLRTA